MRLHFSPHSLPAYHKPSLTHLTPAIPLPTFHPSSPVNLAPSSPCTLSPANHPPTLPYPQFHQTPLEYLPPFQSYLRGHLEALSLPPWALSLTDIGHQPTGTGRKPTRDHSAFSITRLGP